MTLRKNKISRKRLSKRTLLKNRKHTRSQNGGSGNNTGLTPVYMPRQTRREKSDALRKQVAAYAQEQAEEQAFTKIVPGARGVISRVRGAQLAKQFGESSKSAGPIFRSLMDQPPQLPRASQPSQPSHAPRQFRASRASRISRVPLL